MIEPGTLVSGYRVVRVVGTGGMGTVYAADDPRLPRVDALKVLSAGLSADADFCARFQREADIAATLDHPNIVSIFDRGQTDDGQLWIAMQLVDGIDAEQALTAGTMTAHRAVRVISDVAEALDYAHERGVIHRDVKPANFLIAAPGQPDERTLLGDFGIARGLDDSGLTASASVMATAAFAAPEVSTGDGVSARSDLYSLGASLFRLLTGASPYEDVQGVAAQLLAHVRRPPPAVSAKAPWLGEAFDSVVATAMAKNPNDRYRSGAEFAAAAAAALRQTRTQPMEVGSEVTVAARPDRVEVPQNSPAADKSAADAPAGRRRPRRTWLIAGAVAAVVAVASAGVALTHAGHHGSVVSLPSSPAPAAAPAPTSLTPAVADTELASLLLNQGDIAAIIGVPLTPGEPRTSLDPSRFVNMQPGCGSTMLPVMQTTYDDSGYSAASIQGFPPDVNGNSALEAVVSFRSPDLASAFVARRAQIWQSCAGTKLTLVSPTRDYQLSAPQSVGAVVSTVATRIGKPLSCQHALSSRANVVIDVSVCLSPAINDQAVRIANRIAARIQ